MSRMKTGHILTVLCLFILLFLAACSGSQELAGSSERQGVYFPQLGSNVLDGTSATHADGNTTPLLVGFGTEYALWVECDANVDVDALNYYISADRTTWTLGSAGLAGCDTNLTKYDITDKGVQWIMFDFDINSSNATGALTAILSVK